MSRKDDDIRQLITILQRGLSSDSDESEDDVDEKPSKNTKKIAKSKSNNSSQKPKRLNKFDQMMEKTMHKSDAQIDKLLNVHPPSIRTREFDPVRVQCRVCQRTEEVNPSLILDSPGRYKCNKCSGGPG
jgi:hypothetical protein